MATAELAAQSRGSSVEETGISVVTEQTRELAISQQQAMARYEIEGAIVIAKKFPRNEQAAYAGIISACRRPSFAGDTTYCFPRGNEDIEGPSVYLAREMARLWGNIRYGVDVISDDEDSRTIRAWAWDIQTNTRTSSDANFKKLVYRRKGGWIKPDERDLRELTNRHAAFAVRNCLLTLMPSDFIDDAIQTAKQTLKNGVSENLDDSRKKCGASFGILGVSVDQIEHYLGHPLSQASADEVTKLRQIRKSIADGNSKWADYVADLDPKSPQTGGSVSGSDLTKGKASKADRPESKPKKPDETNQELAARPEFLEAAGAGFIDCDTAEQVDGWYATQKEQAENDAEEAQLIVMRNEALRKVNKKASK